MSDFDKEAEREKLRQQLEEDEESRQHTQRLSELLLKGATMTNGHCDNCGDPIFRYDGQEFCPTCQTEGGAAGGANGQASADAAQTQAAQPNAGGQSTDSSSTDGQSDGDAGTPSSAGVATGAVADAETPSTPTQRQSENTGERPTRDPATTDAPAGGDVAAAAEALRATLTKFSQKAAETDDPGRAREYLAAAREAAEALDALPY